MITYAWKEPLKCKILYVRWVLRKMPTIQQVTNTNQERRRAWGGGGEGQAQSDQGWVSGWCGRREEVQMLCLPLNLRFWATWGHRVWVLWSGLKDDGSQETSMPHTSMPPCCVYPASLKHTAWRALTHSLRYSSEMVTLLWLPTISSFHLTSSRLSFFSLAV